ncbi:MAG: hypothetical protein ACYDAN_05690 [Candidatus Limnocylindrales bacterium]
MATAGVTWFRRAADREPWWIGVGSRHTRQASPMHTWLRGIAGVKEWRPRHSGRQSSLHDAWVQR